MPTPPPKFNRIPSEILDEPNGAAQMAALDELEAEIRLFRNLRIVEEVIKQGGVGAYGAAPKAAKALGITHRKVTDTLSRHPELRPEFRTSTRKRGQKDVTRSE